MVHVDVKKVGRIPDGGGWRAHGRGSDQAKAVNRRKKTERGGYVYLSSAIDGYSRLAYTEALPDEKAITAIAFLHRARTWPAAHGITRIERIVTDNGACYRAESFTRALLGARHQRIAPYTPRHNGKVERYNRILAEASMPGRGRRKPNAPTSWAAGLSTSTITDRTRRSEANHPQHDYRAASPTSWPPTAGALTGKVRRVGDGNGWMSGEPVR